MGNINNYIKDNAENEDPIIAKVEQFLNIIGK
jgi:hypothetical protein